MPFRMPLSKTMYMTKKIFQLQAAAILLVASVLPSCKRDKDESPVLTPSYFISESEKLPIPDAVAVPANEPAGNIRVATYYAEGVQKYKAQVKAGSDPVQYEWVFVAPKATLYNSNNIRMGTHGAGPHWRLSSTDSIWAQAYAPAKTAPSSDPSSIDWLLLKTKTGTTPTGIFTDVLYIQRIATSGGKAPAIAPVKLSDTVDVKYTAVYRFTKKNT